MKGNHTADVMLDYVLRVEWKDPPKFVISYIP